MVWNILVTFEVIATSYITDFLSNYKVRYLESINQ